MKLNEYERLMSEACDRLVIAQEVVKVAEAALRYIDAIPKNIGNALPTMPSFDRDWAGEVIAEANKGALLVGYGYSAEIQSAKSERFTVSRVKTEPFDTPLYTCSLSSQDRA